MLFSRIPLWSAGSAEGELAVPLPMPYHRNVRKMVPRPNAGYSGWAYITDPTYAKNPAHSVRAFLLIQKDLETIFEYVEPSDKASEAYSFRIHELLMRTCIEVEANFRAILEENGYQPTLYPNSDRPKLDMDVYRRVNVTHHLSSFEVLLPIWNGLKRRFRPFSAWHGGQGSVDWYKAYNAAKHDRQLAFEQANLEVLTRAVGGLLVLLTSQFGEQDFSAGPTLLAASGLDYHELDSALGGLFRIKLPDDWAEDEKYDFDWEQLKHQPQRFAKFNYNAI